ncbi:MAG: 16S rRNA (cytosine(967)-C(5))-methyltransferase RsmB [Calditrichaeota bacterium]|nr:16S rRNA (cytosine(967)-C(5))-methyltransferase RsmB [Calditrichota bacterium]
MMPPREAAIRAYARWLKNPGRIETLAGRELDASPWDRRDRGLYLEILYGTVRQKGRLEWIIAQLDRTNESHDPMAIAAVSTGLYQFLFLDRVPEHAIVDGSVEAVRRAGGGGATGWVNALLRRVGREAGEWKIRLPDTDRSPSPALLSVEFSHPEWLVTRYLKRLAPDNLRRHLTWNNRRPEVHLRINRLRTSPEDFLAGSLAQESGARPHSVDPFFITLPHGITPGEIEAVRSGRAQPQDVSQGLVAKLLNPDAGEEILDLCSAPGGKCTHMAELAPDARIAATDSSADRLTMLEAAIRRSGYANIELVPYDDLLASKRQFDAVLVDAPCTGTGVLARRPDLRWRRRPDDIRRMASLQLNLLKYAADRVRPGGRIVYSTCSVEPEENRELIGQFLADRSDFAFRSGAGLIPDDLLDEAGRIDLWGEEIGGDGVFAVQLIRQKAAVRGGR